MEIKYIEKEFKEKVCKEIRLMQEGIDDLVFQYCPNPQS